MVYGTWPNFRGGSSFHGKHIFRLKLYFLTSCQVYQRLSSVLFKKNNKDCFCEGFSIFFFDPNLNMGVKLCSKWVDFVFNFLSKHCGYTFKVPLQGGSNEYPQSMFWIRNKKICIPLYTPVLLDYLKWVISGYTLLGHVILMRTGTIGAKFVT